MTGVEERRRRRKEEDQGFVFWNIAEISNKFNEMWEYLGLAETQIDRRGWEKLRNNLSKKFIWTCVPATREYKKERARKE